MLSSLSNKLESIYATAKVCRDVDNCLTLDPELSDLMTSSRNYSDLLWAWKGWHDAAGRPMRQIYTQTVSLRNKGARDNDFKDLSEEWMEDFETTNFESIMDDLFNEIKPLYQQLHAYTRRKLNEFYKKSFDANKFNSKLIQAHLLGNMWAQGWENIYDILKPYPNASEIDLNEYLKSQKYSANDFFEVNISLLFYFLFLV